MDNKALKIVGTALAAYAGYEVYQLSQLSKNFSYSVAGFEIKKGPNSTLDVVFGVRFKNTSSVPVPLSRVSGSIYTKDASPKLLCRFSTEKSIVLEANKETTFSIVANVTGASFISALAQLVSVSNPVVTVYYSVIARPTVAFFIPIPIATKAAQDIDIKSSLAGIKDTFSTMQPYLATLSGLAKLTDAGFSLVDALKKLKGK